MFLRRDLFDRFIIEINGGIASLLDSMRENNLLGLFARARIKTDFLLKCPIPYFTSIMIQMARRGIDIFHYAKKGRIISKELSSC